MAFLGLIGMIGILTGLVMLVPALVKRKSKKRALGILGGSALLFIIAAAFTTPETPTIELVKGQVETNASGIATITGEVSKGSTLMANGEKIKLSDTAFSHEVALKDGESQKITFVAKKGSEEKTIIAEVKPSKAFLASLEENQEENRATDEAEAALVLAEKEPNQKNYDEASTRIQALTKEQQETYSLRLKTVQEKITKEQAKQKAIASAQEAVTKAEQEPTNENYQQAAAAVNALEKADTSLSDRITKVKETLDNQAKQQAEAEKKAEAERLAQEQALAAQAAAEAETEAQQAAAQQQASGETVLVTATGSKYHTHKCGNGTYTPATLAEAQARGLTPCEKCY